MTSIRLNQVVYPVTALGPGDRLGIWFQGCTLGCRGCMATDTWDPEGGRGVGVDDVVAIASDCADEGLDGVTISGGEPFQQPAGLFALLEALNEWRTGSGLTCDFLCYSGYRWDHIEEAFPHIVNLLDAIVPEPFVESNPSKGVWRGSGNQSIIPLTELGSSRYLPEVVRGQESSMQVNSSEGRFSLIGVPQRGDLEALGRLLNDEGVHLGDVTWR